MTQLTFLPHFPFTLHPLLLFGVLLLAGVLGGELVRRVLRLPRITGYVLTGLLLGPGGLAVLSEPLLEEAWIFVDIALGLLLFELGQRLDVAWLVRERWLLATGILESVLSFACVYTVLSMLGVAPLLATVAAAIGISTSPAVVMLVAKELKAEGQITERALHLVAINSVIAFTLTTMLLSWMHEKYQAGWLVTVLHPLYMLIGSLVLGSAACMVALVSGRWLGKDNERQFVMLLALVVLTVGAAHMLELSVLLALLTFGVMVRNLDARHDVIPIDVGRVGQLFFVVLFVVTGARLASAQLMSGGVIGIAYVLARFAGKSAGIIALMPFTHVRPGAAGLLCITLTPMSGLALAMLQGASHVYPELGVELANVMLSGVLLVELLGPIAVQFALTRAGEVVQENNRS
jgi:Kef-type K+ transport system membrane component KefB